jgi:hypothetical protein
MADEPSRWPAPGVFDTPKGRFNRALLRDFALVLPWLVLVALAGALAGRWAALAAFAAIVVVRAVRFAVTGTTASLRRAGVRIVRRGTGAEPERWRLAAYQLGPFVVIGVVLALGRSVPYLFAIVLVAYLVLGTVTEMRARRRGRDIDAQLALFGLDVVWADGPPD